MHQKESRAFNGIASSILDDMNELFMKDSTPAPFQATP
jgi:hypothetical protein